MLHFPKLLTQMCDCTLFFTSSNQTLTSGVTLKPPNQTRPQQPVTAVKNGACGVL